MSFLLYKQFDVMYCGPACLRLVAKLYRRNISLDYLQNKPEYGKQDVSFWGLTDSSEAIGLKSLGTKLTFEQLISFTQQAQDAKKRCR